MSRYHSHLNSAALILNSYKGDQPFHIFLKSYFSQHKKFGSKDRKQVSHLCYTYFRLGQALLQMPLEERILTGLFVCQQQPSEMLEFLKPEWNELIALPPNEKLHLLRSSVLEIFPWWRASSEGVDAKSFSASLLMQPDLYLRLRPGMEATVKQKLQDAGINFNEINQHCLSLENAVQIDKLVELDKEAVVQDYNSQRVGEFLDYARNSLPAPLTPTLRLGQAQLRVYDCCAASGGKSILAYDTLPQIDLTVSDIRESILVNLNKRFKRAGIKNFTSFIEDLSIPGSKYHKQMAPQAKHKPFDLVICDAPCTGSGTWGRTPEQLYYFQTERIDHYRDLQRSILENVVSRVRKGGSLLYITCSVFKAENEEAVEFLEKEFKFRLQKMELLTGYDKKADTLFAALLEA